MARIAIHGFGRIGRSLMRVALKDNLFVPVSISDIKDVPTLAALFEVDSNYGRWPEEVTTKDSCFARRRSRDPLLRLDEGAAGLEGPRRRSGDRLHGTGHHASRRPGPSRCRRQARAGERAEQEARRLRRGPAAGHQPRHVRSATSTRSSAWRAARPTRWRRSSRS